MVIRIDLSSDTPIYVQLRNEIVKGIGKGELLPGENLPTVRQLSAELGVNAMTVSKAYQILKTEGYIETDRRRGAAVRAAGPKGAAAENGREKMESTLELLSAEAKLQGMDREEFLRLCGDAFAQMEV
ncbi:GntR family transcriptional regulator [Ruminococcus sp. CLA-AA-H200]|uniref:GntR family transcriptional regulator n=1 Tax=Ruminococcus turbiniformis TaxID=2881258 RepID=A0ABS8G0R1_9FIRM|nr:GntR family transcriptional regulator [Ruminococcus turbiniformis]MCC2255022.1 GntR family transcriptional regulator [Ruminococcus turbiniformis]